MVSAHRIESRAGLRAAVALEVEFVELDVRVHADGTFVVAHDEPLADSLPYDEALAAIAAAGKSVHLDLKLASPRAAYDVPESTFEVAATARAVAVLGADRVVATTGRDRSVRALRTWAATTHHPDLMVGLSLGRGWPGPYPLRLVRQLASELFPARRIRESGANLVVAHRRLARLTVAAYARRRGLPLLVWTVDADPALRYWLDRAWLVATNRPEAALVIRSEVEEAS